LPQVRSHSTPLIRPIMLGARGALIVR
jgi:hypothetical protein